MPKSFWESKPVGRPLAIAHRGGGASFGKDKYKKENTLEAFAKTVGLGYSYFEMDVIATSDDRVAVVHVAKNQFEAAQGKKEAPSYQSLQKMTYEEVAKTLTRPVPLLDEVLKSLPDTKFFIDAKTDKVVELLAQLIIQHKLKNRICVGSFYPERVAKAAAILGDGIATCLNISRSPAHFLSQWPYLKDLNSRPTCVHLPYIFLTKAVIQNLHKKGLKVLVWTPNTRSKIKRCIGLGADGIISDNVELLKQIIDNHNSQ